MKRHQLTKVKIQNFFFENKGTKRHKKKANNKDKRKPNKEPTKEKDPPKVHVTPKKPKTKV